MKDLCHKKGQYFAEFLGHPEKRPCNSLYYKGLQMVSSERLPCF